MQHRRSIRAAGTSWASAVLACVGLISMLCIVFGALALVVGETRPTTRHTSVARPWTTTTTFGWFGTAAANDIYPDGRVQSPQPVYLRLLSDVVVTADVTSSGAVPAGRNPLTLRATLGDATGWSRTWALDRTMAGAGSAHLSAPLSLGLLLDETSWNQNATGVPSPVTLTLTVDPGRADVPASQLTFSLDHLLFRPVGPLTRTAGGTVYVPRTTAGVVRLAGNPVSVAHLRTAGALLLGTGLLGVAGAALAGRADRRQRRPAAPARAHVPLQRWAAADVLDATPEPAHDSSGEALPLA